MLGVFRRLREGCRRVFATTEWAEFAGADWAETIFDAVTTDRLVAKQGRSTSRWRLTQGDGDGGDGGGGGGQSLVVYLKRHYRLPRWRGVLAAFSPQGGWSPGWGEYNKLKIAASLGIPVPRVVAVAEYVRRGGHLQSVLVLQELTGMLPLHRAIPQASRGLDAAEFARWKRGLIGEMARLTGRLHDGHWFHKDLYLCHFYVAEADTVHPPATWTARVYMIDFHRLGRHAVGSGWWQAKDLGQLLYSSEVEGIGPRDRVRFWRAYRLNRRGWLWLVRRVALVRAGNHRGHNEAKPQLPAKAV